MSEVLDWDEEKRKTSINAEISLKLLGTEALISKLAIIYPRIRALVYNVPSFLFFFSFHKDLFTSYRRQRCSLSVNILSKAFICSFLVINMDA